MGFWGALEKGGARVMRGLRGEWGVMGEGSDESESIVDFVRGEGFSRLGGGDWEGLFEGLLPFLFPGVR